jgi:hypothetical protein
VRDTVVPTLLDIRTPGHALTAADSLRENDEYAVTRTLEDVERFCRRGRGAADHRTSELLARIDHVA